MKYYYTPISKISVTMAANRINVYNLIFGGIIHVWKGACMEKILKKIKEIIKMAAFFCRQGLATMFGTY